MEMHDSLGYVKSLESAGISTKQAEAQVQMMTDIINSNLVTRQDLREQTLLLRSELRESEIQLRSEIRSLEDRMTIRLGSMMIAAVGVILTAFGGLAAFIHFVH